MGCAAVFKAPITYSLDVPLMPGKYWKPAIDNAAQAITEARRCGCRICARHRPSPNDLAKAIEVLGGELEAHQKSPDGDSTDFSVHVEGMPLEFNPILRMRSTESRERLG